MGAWSGLARGSASISQDPLLVPHCSAGMCVIVCSQPDGSILDSAIEDHYGGLDNYVSYMSKDGSWGDGLILSVAAILYQKKIAIYADNMEHVMKPFHISHLSESTKDHDDPANLSLGFVDGNHYISLRKSSDTQVGLHSSLEEPCSSGLHSATVPTGKVVHDVLTEAPAVSTPFKETHRPSCPVDAIKTRTLPAEFQGYHPPAGLMPCQQLLKSKRKFYFQQKWFDTYPWLTYDPALKAVRCVHCSKASELGLLKQAKCVETCFVSDGYSNWKKAAGTDGRFESHELSRCHLFAKEALFNRMQRVPVTSKLSQQVADQQDRAREALKMIFSSVAFLARQGLPLRGHDDTEGNFLQLLYLRATDVPQLREWIAQKTTYTHHDIQNEILRLYAHAVLRKICGAIQQSRCFAVMVDGTQDIARNEQESFCIRYVDSAMQPQEAFVGFYAVEDTTGKGLARCVEDVLLQLQLPMEQLRGQTYDGASNMSGAYKGCQAIIAKKQPLATYVHCSAHVTNLVATAAASASTLIRDSIECVNELGVLCNASGKFKSVLTRVAANSCDGPVRNLKPLCPTRWLIRVPAIEAALSQYALIIATLQEAEGTCSTEVATRAAGLHRRFADGSTLMCLAMAVDVLSPLECLNKALQSVSMTVAGMLESAKKVKACLLELRTADHFSGILVDTIRQIEDLQLEELHMPRARRPPKRLTGQAEAYSPQSVEEYYQTEYFKMLDVCIQQMSDRMLDCPGLQKYCELEDILLSGSVGPVIENYPEFHSAQALQAEVSMFRKLPALTTGSQVTLQVCLDAYRTLSADVQRMFCNTEILMRLLAVNPASSATAERSFSSLRRLKTYVRCTTSQQRLNHLALCHIHKDILDTLDVTLLMKEFVSASDRRSCVFGKI